MQRGIVYRRWSHPAVSSLLILMLLCSALWTASTAAATGTYANPLLPSIPGGGVVESCADPSVIKGQGDDPYWYMYCTTDPLNDEDRTPSGFVFHRIPQFRSLDLINWVYMGDAFASVPSWGDPTAGIWAPEIDYIDGTYYLFYGVTDVAPAVSGTDPSCHNDNAIGYATSENPLGPWTDSGAPLIAPRRNAGACDFFWTYDPEVIEAETGQRYIYYGSYYGGIEVRTLNLATDGSLAAPAESKVPVTIPNRYEGAEVIFKDGYYYLFVSATNCCNGPLTAYSVFVGRSPSPTGPFVDREGVSLLAGRVGGTPVIVQNGNRWVGPGHNTVFQDVDGQWWTIYHAVDRNDPYFEGAVGFTKRPALLDALVWDDGWPSLNGGHGPSDKPQEAPAAQPGQTADGNERLLPQEQAGALLFEDTFDGAALASHWSWVRQPSAGYSVQNGAFQFETQAADLFVDNNSASVLTAPLPDGNYVLETRVMLDLPPEGCCHNYVQAGIVVYDGDDNYIKLTHVSIWETRQTEFAKELAPVPAGYPRYGNTVVGPPSDWTYLRIAKRTEGGEELYTAYTSQDGERWVRGGTWTHNLGEDARIGLVAMGGTGFTATFDYVRVYRLIARQIHLPQLYSN